MVAEPKIDTGLPVYFADPHSPWPRGTNENTNGLLRQYFPKDTDLSRWSAEEIEAVAAALNSRPAKPSTGRHPPRHSTSTYDQSTKLVLRPPVEPGQYTAIRYAQRQALSPDQRALIAEVKSMWAQARTFTDRVEVGSDSADSRSG